jgi:SAM-dependent methyltransferase
MSHKSTSATCRICNTTGVFPAWLAPEMMFGTRETFEYFRCENCGTLQIAVIPDDMSKYYPAAYYQDAEPASAKQGLAGRLYCLRDVAAASGDKFGLGALVNYLKSDEMLQSVGFAGMGKDSRILDVGCGPGILLKQLRQLGFTHLEGLDAYWPADLEENGLRIQSGRIENVAIPEGGFDLLMFHHSLEHVSEPARVLSRAKEFLAPGGKVLVRVPVSDSFAWKYYGTNWVQLDPPRHFYLLTDRSMALLAEQAGLKIERQMRDSGSFQFWASQGYSKGLPLKPASLPSRTGPKGIARIFQRLAALALNATGAGDQAVYVLKPAR